MGNGYEKAKTETWQKNSEEYREIKKEWTKKG